MISSNTNWPKTTRSYKELKNQISNDKDFCIALQTSLMIAQEGSRSVLHNDLYHALDNVFGGNGLGWPTTPDAYLKYVEQYLILIPNEMDDPNYPNAWTSDNTQNGYNQKVYDLICQFYYLVDQPLPMQKITLQDYKKGSFNFGDWLRDFAIDWGKFLNTKESLPSLAMESFIANPKYNIPLYSKNSNNWKSFNEFFYREFNNADKKGQSPLRPIAEPKNNNVITSPADCTYKMAYPIDGER